MMRILHISNDEIKLTCLRYLWDRYVTMVGVGFDNQGLDTLRNGLNTFSGFICDFDSTTAIDQRNKGWDTLSELLINFYPPEFPVFYYSFRGQHPDHTALTNAGFSVNYLQFSELEKQVASEEEWMHRVVAYHKILEERKAVPRR